MTKADRQCWGTNLLARNALNPRHGTHALRKIVAESIPMKFLNPVVAFLAVLLLVSSSALVASDDEETATHAAPSTPTTIVEARSRAMLLHEVIRGTLQVVHRDFFDEDNSLAIPSASFEDVFHGVEYRFDVKLRWLVVNADVVNVDHQAVDDFEKNAAILLAADKPYVEATVGNLYRFAGPIRLESQCLKCHVKMRTSNLPRKAGLLISMPLILKE